MKASPKLRKLLASPGWEGCELREYTDAGGYPSIGVGHKLLDSEIRSGMLRIDGEMVAYSAGISHEDALRLLEQDLAIAEQCITTHVKVELSQNQFDALCAFVFWAGIGHFIESTLLQVINARNFEAVPAQLRRWVNSGGKRLAGLISRRENEIAMWEGKL